MKKNKIIKSILRNVVNIWSDLKRFGLQTQVNECEHCGKKVGKNPRHVHIMTNGIIVPTTIKEKHIEKIGEQSQGCFPIADQCAEKLFGSLIDEYTFRYND